MKNEPSAVEAQMRGRVFHINLDMTTMHIFMISSLHQWYILFHEVYHLSLLMSSE